jgi:hypothetical protein
MLYTLPLLYIHFSISLEVVFKTTIRLKSNKDLYQNYWWF